MRLCGFHPTVLLALSTDHLLASSILLSVQTWARGIRGALSGLHPSPMWAKERFGFWLLAKSFYLDSKQTKAGQRQPAQKSVPELAGPHSPGPSGRSPAPEAELRLRPAPGGEVWVGGPPRGAQGRHAHLREVVSAEGPSPHTGPARSHSSVYLGTQRQDSSGPDGSSSSPKQLSASASASS